MKNSKRLLKYLQVIKNLIDKFKLSCNILDPILLPMALSFNPLALLYFFLYLPFSFLFFSLFFFPVFAVIHRHKFTSRKKENDISVPSALGNSEKPSFSSFLFPSL